MKRRSAIALIVVVVLVLATALALRWVTRPQTLGPRLLDMAGQALGLELAADEFGYRLRGSPRLVARGVTARAADSTVPLLEAERVMVAVPWSTLRSFGADPMVTRVELDAPRLQLQPFMHWWSRRPRGDGPLATLREGLHLDRGHIDGGDWSLQDIAIDLPHFAADQRLGASVRGDFQTGAIQVPFNLQVAMTRPALDAGIGVAGTATPRAGEWRLPSRLRLSTRLAATAPGDAGAGFMLQRLRLSASSRYVSADTTQPFALGLAARGTFADAALTLEPAAIALRGQDMIPHLHGTGMLGYDQALELSLAGSIEHWPEAWPALPSPIGDTDAPLPFQLRYRGVAGLSDPLELELTRDDTRFQGRLRVPEVMAWIGEAATGTPLPPLDGHLATPRLDIVGASLHGVEITVSDQDSTEDEQP